MAAGILSPHRELGLPGLGRADEQASVVDPGLKRDVLVGVVEEIDDLPQL